MKLATLILTGTLSLAHFSVYAEEPSENQLHKQAEATERKYDQETIWDFHRQVGAEMCKIPALRNAEEEFTNIILEDLPEEERKKYASLREVMLFLIEQKFEAANNEFSQAHREHREAFHANDKAKLEAAARRARNSYQNYKKYMFAPKMFGTTMEYLEVMVYSWKYIDQTLEHRISTLKKSANEPDQAKAKKLETVLMDFRANKKCVINKFNETYDGHTLILETPPELSK